MIMAEQLRKFVNRPTRYFFNPEDDHFIRFSSNERTDSILAEMLNISSTGLAFIINKASSPKMGQLIRIEFTVPGGDKMAWWGYVRRVANFVPPDSWASTAREDLIGLDMIGVESKDFPVNREQKLANDLEVYFSGTIKKALKKEKQKTSSFLVENWGKFSLIVGCVFLVSYLLYLLSSSLSIYNNNNDVPWGESSSKSSE